MKCKYENKNGTCGLKGSYAYRHKCFTEDLCKCFEPLSNADRIRSMSDDELAEAIMCPNEFNVYGKPLKCKSVSGKDCVKCCLDWLRQPSEE